MVVVLPQPVEPRKPKISPRRMRKLTWSTATKSPKRMVRSRASIAASVASSPSVGRVWGVITRARWPSRCSGGNRAMKASSRVRAPVPDSSSTGVPAASTRPALMAASQSKRAASSM